MPEPLTAPVKRPGAGAYGTSDGAMVNPPLAPKNPLPYWQRLKAARRFDTGPQRLRDAGGCVTRNILGPSWLGPPLVFVTSPAGAREILGRTDDVVERAATPMSWELRRLFGDNLLVVAHADWLPRRRALQAIFTKQRVPQFAGRMAEAAERLSRQWCDAAEINLDTQCRALTLEALGRTVLGAGLGERGPVVGDALRTAVRWSAGRALRPVNLPYWLPTPGQRAARAAVAALRELAAEILAQCRTDPERDAPLVRALMAAADPQTGEALTDRAICDELMLFLMAGHDTTSTTLAYTLWALGQRPELQRRVADEVAGIGDRRLVAGDVPRLSFTVQVLHEALRMCPPAPVVGRSVLRDIVVEGFRVEAGSFVIVGIYALHHDPTLWEAPDTFDPDRFSPGRSKLRDRWQYLPFGGGPRACMGDHFAMLEATLCLATIIRHVEITALDDAFPTATPLTTIAAAPIRARVRARTRVDAASSGRGQRTCGAIL
jgi:cytochrome P450